jgi:transcriptional regulator with XRE-family HTH domain
MKTLKQHRLAANFGLREFAERIGLLPSDYCDIEQGRREATHSERNVICAPLDLLELPPCPPSTSDGPIIPVFVKTVDGKPLSDEAARKLYEDLNAK